jgi:hypothetical protein
MTIQFVMQIINSPLQKFGGNINNPLYKKLKVQKNSVQIAYLKKGEFDKKFKVT